MTWFFFADLFKRKFPPFLLHFNYKKNLVQLQLLHESCWEGALIEGISSIVYIRTSGYNAWLADLRVRRSPAKRLSFGVTIIVYGKLLWSNLPHISGSCSITHPALQAGHIHPMENRHETRSNWESNWETIGDRDHRNRARKRSYGRSQPGHYNQRLVVFRKTTQYLPTQSDRCSSLGRSLRFACMQATINPWLLIPKLAIDHLGGRQLFLSSLLILN